MKPYPHHYTASANATAIGSVAISAPTLPQIETAAPPEFDGPGGTWSPEALLCAAVADCFVLTFRGIARAAHYNWMALECRVEGVLEHIGGTTQFTSFATAAQLTVPPGADHAKARALLSRAERACLISNSLRGERTLSIEVQTGGLAHDRPTDPGEHPVGDIGQRASPAEPEAVAGHLP